MITKDMLPFHSGFYSGHLPVKTLGLSTLDRVAILITMDLLLRSMQNLHFNSSYHTASTDVEARLIKSYFSICEMGKKYIREHH